MTSEQAPEITPGSGLDRRSALKKAAVAGAVAWTVPTIISQKALAVEFIDGCTAKCQPPGTIDVAGLLTVEPCTPDIPEDQQIIQGTLSAAVTVDSPSECPCGGTVTATLVTPAPGQIVPLSSIAGTVTPFFTVTLTITCSDRSGNPLQRSCSGEAQGFASGNCASLGGNSYQWIARLPCGPSQCIIN